MLNAVQTIPGALILIIFSLVLAEYSKHLFRIIRSKQVEKKRQLAQEERYSRQFQERCENMDEEFSRIFGGRPQR